MDKFEASRIYIERMGLYEFYMSMEELNNKNSVNSVISALDDLKIQEKIISNQENLPKLYLQDNRYFSVLYIEQSPCSESFLEYDIFPINYSYFIKHEEPSKFREVIIPKELKQNFLQKIELMGIQYEYGYDWFKCPCHKSDGKYRNEI